MSSHPPADPSRASQRGLRLRIVVSGSPERAGEETIVATPVTIGRDAVCRIVLDDPSVSRQHARVEPAEGGLRVVDLGSGNGVWMGTERIQDRVLAPGEQFQIGATVFGCVAEQAEAPPEDTDAKTVLLPIPGPVVAAPAARPTGPVLLRVIEGGIGVAAGTELLLNTVVTLGRADECDLVFAEQDVSRAHARLEITADGVALTDLGSTYRTWVADREVERALLKPGDRFRLGGRVQIELVAPPAAAAVPVSHHPHVEERDVTQFVFSPKASAAAPPPPAVVSPPPPPPPVPVAAPPAVAPAPAPTPAAAVPAVAAPPAPAAVVPAAEAPVDDADFSGTVVIPVAKNAPAGPGRLEEAGALIDVSAHRPFLLDDPGSVWLVVEGGVMIFTVALDKGEAVGGRTHFLGVLPGQAMFGFDLKRYGVGSGFLAVARQGTRVRKIPMETFKQLAATPAHAEAAATMLDSWALGLSKALIANLTTKRAQEQALLPDQRVELAKNATATASDGVLWIDIASGSVLFDDMATPTFTRRSVPFPLTPHSWIQPMSDEFGALSVRPKRTAAVVVDPGVWYGLDAFHAVLCECEFIGKKLSAVDEVLRLQNKAQQSEAAREAAYDAIGSVLSSEGETPNEFRAQGDAEAVLRACELVAEAVGMEAKEHPAKADNLTFEEQVQAIAMASGFRTRVVALRDDWWRQDNGPLLGQWAESKDPVALLPTNSRSCEVVDPKAGKRAPVTAASSVQLSDFAYTFYRPFPDGDLTLGQVVRFGSRQIGRDVVWVASLAMVLGVFGTVTPYITGTIFDAAIPQADRASLVLLGAALLSSALASSAFKFVQGVATIRVQRRMAAPIQSAMWDRILNLPVNFFRRFSAGDLADRADGIADIQDLVSGAGVAAILGSISGIFYVLQMFGYDLTLAMVAIVLTLIFVAVNMTANYLQLRYQRREFAVRGVITGLVLNLLTGVNKLRVSGAESHAFRIWAEQFAQQRRLTFTVGSIQNLASVFTSTYPVICSIVIFYTLVGLQTGGAAPLTTGAFLAFNAAFGLFMASMQALGDASLSLLNAVPMYERLLPILEEKPEVDRSKAFPGKLKGAIELSRVSFRYSSDGPWILKDISLKIQPGEMVAFVGSSGGGKSTLMRLMLGFETPTAGAILYDGQDLNSVDLRMLRQQLGVVLQTSRVMPTEMYRNIIGAGSKTIEDAWSAAERAGLAEDIRAMPMGMHTYVSEGGGTLSGGQRQRLMIARAIVNSPKVLFLDEATSALDNRAQAIVTESMDKMDSTRIVIAHRLSTVINSNRICYLHGGQLVEQGTYDELMKLNGMFAALAKRQMA